MSLHCPRRAVLALVLALTAGACDDAATTPATDTATATDTLEAVADTVEADAAADVQIADTAAVATTLVVTATIAPDPPTTGRNTLTLTVHDDLGAAVTGAALTVDPQMPMHGHGSSEVAVVTEVGAGVYTASPVTFQMAGMWKVTIAATAGALSGSLVVDYTVR